MGEVEGVEVARTTITVTTIYNRILQLRTNFRYRPNACRRRRLASSIMKYYTMIQPNTLAEVTSVLSGCVMSTSLGKAIGPSATEVNKARTC